MLLYAKNIIGGKVREIAGLNDLGTISDLVIEKDSGKIIALLVRKNLSLFRPMVLSTVDVLEFYNKGVLIKEEKDIVEIEDILRIKEILKDRFKILGSKVITQKGKFLGYLRDFSFDSESNYMATLIVQKRFSKEKRIMNIDRILSITKNKIIIRDIIENSLSNKVKRELQSITDTWGILKKKLSKEI